MGLVGYVSTLQKTLALGKRDKTLKNSTLAICPTGAAVHRT